MNAQICRKCKHFYQHYSLDAKKIFRVYCGHCSFMKVRRKHPDSPACENFVLGESDESAFASKEYLSKELLNYMMQLELLPEIRDNDADGK